MARMDLDAIEAVLARCRIASLRGKPAAFYPSCLISSPAFRRERADGFGRVVNIVDSTHVPLVRRLQQHGPCLIHLTLLLGRQGWPGGPIANPGVTPIDRIF